MTRLLNTPQLFVCLIFVLFMHSANAQDFEWVKQLGATSGKGSSNKVAADHRGNIYTLGTYTGTVDFDPGPGSYTLTASTSSSNSSYANNYLCKLDSLGNFIWVRDLGSSNNKSANDLAIDNYGNPIITGDFTGNIDFDPGVGTYTLLGLGRPNCFILKLNTSGNFMWAKCFEGDSTVSGSWGFPWSECYGYSIGLDSAQNIYISGVLEGCVDFDPDTNTRFTRCGVSTYMASMWGPGNTFFLVKLDSVGKFIYVNTNANSFGQVLQSAQMDVQKSGEVIVSGTEEDRHLNSRFFVIKYASDGTTAWVNSILRFMNSRSVAVDRYHNIYVHGFFRESIDFDAGPGVYNLSAPEAGALFILKLDSMGNFLQAQQIDCPMSSSIPNSQVTTDPAGDLYISGSFKGTVDFAPNIGQTVNLSSTNNSGFILKLDPFGEFVWVKQIGENSATLNDMALDNFGNIYTTGSFTGTADFDPAGTYNLSAFGNSDAFVHKLSGPLITGMAEQILRNDLSLYPNPTNAQVYLNTTVALDHAMCRIMDLSGRTIQEKRNINGTSFEIDLSAQPKGLYLLEVSDSSSISRVKLIKE